MTAKATTLAAALLAVGAGAAAGAGAASAAGAAAGAGAASGAGAAAGAAPSHGITRYLALHSELPGLTFDRAHVLHSAKAWVGDEPADEAKPEIARYKAEGFRQAAYENFTGPRSTNGVSNVIVFATKAGARNDQNTVLHPVGKSKRFSVKGIPGGRGFTQGDTQHGNAADVVWVEGRCTMVIGEFVPTGVVKRGPLINAAQAVYHRTRGRCP
jgi:hypothetical protein